jgi:hypothetical protein
LPLMLAALPPWNPDLAANSKVIPSIFKHL